MRKRKTVEATVEEKKLALQLSKIYKRLLVSELPFMKPWRSDIPIQEQTVFACFVRTARTVVDLKAKPRDYITAQFECWNGPPHKKPQPRQLATQGAIDRYNEWYQQNKAWVPEKTAPKKTAKKRDELRLKSYQERTGLSVKAVLRRDPLAFSRRFLERHGVWEDVSEQWMAGRE